MNPRQSQQQSSLYNPSAASIRGPSAYSINQNNTDNTFYNNDDTLRLPKIDQRTTQNTNNSNIMRNNNTTTLNRSEYSLSLPTIRTKVPIIASSRLGKNHTFKLLNVDVEYPRTNANNESIYPASTIHYQQQQRGTNLPIQEGYYEEEEDDQSYQNIRKPNYLDNTNMSHKIIYPSRGNGTLIQNIPISKSVNFNDFTNNNITTYSRAPNINNTTMSVNLTRQMAELENNNNNLNNNFQMLLNQPYNARPPMLGNSGGGGFNANTNDNNEEMMENVNKMWSMINQQDQDLNVMEQNLKMNRNRYAQDRAQYELSKISNMRSNLKNYQKDLQEIVREKLQIMNPDRPPSWEDRYRSEKYNHGIYWNPYNYLENDPLFELEKEKYYMSRPRKFGFNPSLEAALLESLKGPKLGNVDNSDNEEKKNKKKGKKKHKKNDDNNNDKEDNPTNKAEGGGISTQKDIPNTDSIKPKDSINPNNPQFDTLSNRSRTTTLIGDKQMSNRPTKIKKFNVSLRALLWTMAYPFLMPKYVVEYCINKRNGYGMYLQNTMKERYADLVKWLWNMIKPSVEDIIMDKKSYDIDTSPEKIKEKSAQAIAELPNRAELVGYLIRRLKPHESEQKKVTAILECLKKGIQAQPLNEDMLDFFALNLKASFTTDNGIILNGFVSQFELDRLEFNRYGRLKKVTPVRNQMLFACMLLLRVLLFRILLKAWTHMKVRITELIRINLLIISSVIYVIIMEYLRNNLKKVYNNQGHIINQDIKMTPMDPIFPVEIVGDKDPKFSQQNENEVINGLLSKENLMTFFNTNSKYCEPTANTLLDWIEELSKQILTYAAYKKANKSVKRNRRRK